jgi:hypothetical protein
MRLMAIFAVCVVFLSRPIGATTEQYRTYVVPASTETIAGAVCSFKTLCGGLACI